MLFPQKIKISFRYSDTDRQQTLTNFKSWLASSSADVSPLKQSVLTFLIAYVEKSCMGDTKKQTNANRAVICENIFNAAKQSDADFLAFAKEQIKLIGHFKGSSLKKGLKKILNSIKLKPAISAPSQPARMLQSSSSAYLLQRLDTNSNQIQASSQVVQPIELATASSTQPPQRILPQLAPTTPVQPVPALPTQPEQQHITQQLVPASAAPIASAPFLSHSVANTSQPFFNSVTGIFRTGLHNMGRASIFGLGMGLRQVHNSMEEWDILGAVPHGIQATLYYTALSFALQLVPNPQRTTLLASIGLCIAIDDLYHNDVTNWVLHPINSITGSAFDGFITAAWAFATSASDSAESSAKPAYRR